MLSVWKWLNVMIFLTLWTWVTKGVLSLEVDLVFGEKARKGLTLTKAKLG